MPDYTAIQGFGWLTLGDTVNLTFSIKADTHSNIFAATAGYSNITDGNITYATNAMNLWQSVADISFSVDDSNPDIGFYHGFHSDKSALGSTKAFANNPYITDVDIYINNNPEALSGSNIQFTYLHELGHALGLCE